MVKYIMYMSFCIGSDGEEGCRMLNFKNKNRPGSGKNPIISADLYETELVLKMKKEEMFNPYVFMPHAELNNDVYECVDSFVDKYKGDEMSLLIYTDSVNPMIQDVFREVYREHYEDEYKKVNRQLDRFRLRFIILIIISIAAFIISNHLAVRTDHQSIFSYLIGNVSCFCLWEVGNTHFRASDLFLERKRVKRSMDAKIEFQ